MFLSYNNAAQSEELMLVGKEEVNIPHAFATVIPRVRLDALFWLQYFTF